MFPWDSQPACGVSVRILIYFFTPVTARLCVHSHHGFVVEGKALQLPQGVGGCSELLEHNEGLAPHLVRLQGHNVQDLSELGEESVERALQLCRNTNQTVKQQRDLSRAASVCPTQQPDLCPNPSFQTHTTFTF